jgi:tRNA(fMet)-specific endonuclease VapC
VLSAIAAGERDAYRAFARTASSCHSVHRLGEYCFGIVLSNRREYERWLKQMLSLSEVLQFDEETAMWYSDLRSQLKAARTSIPSNEAWIAALCRQHDLPLLSRDQHFDFVEGVRLLDW